MSKRKNEFECLLSMPDLGKYIGKWIAIVDDEIVSVGNAGKVVFKKARKRYPQKTPLLVKIPTDAIMLL